MLCFPMEELLSHKPMFNFLKASLLHTFLDLHLFSDLLLTNKENNNDCTQNLTNPGEL